MRFVFSTGLLSAIRTDLSLLLECLKFQMKSPDLQKQALLTIHSICEKRGNSETVKEMPSLYPQTLSQLVTQMYCLFVYSCFKCEYVLIF